MPPDPAWANEAHVEPDRAARPTAVTHVAPPSRPRSNANGSGTSTPAVAVVQDSFPSPGQPHALQPSFVGDVQNLTTVLKSAWPPAARVAVRNNWKTCLSGSDYHLAFVLNATLHEATPKVIKTLVLHYGTKFTSVALPELGNHLTTTDLDQLEDILLPKLSDKFLDRVLAHRLNTISSKGLIDALAKAERLGYETSDVGEEGEGSQANGSHPSASAPVPGMAPSMAHQSQTAGAYTPGQVLGSSVALPHVNGVASSASTPENSGALICHICHRIFEQSKTWKYHMKHMKGAKGPLCTREDQAFNTTCACPHCGLTFTTKQGLIYHVKMGVCGDYPETCVQPMSEVTSTPTQARSSSQIMTPSTLHSSTPGHIRGASPQTPMIGSYEEMSPEALQGMRVEFERADRVYLPRIIEALQMSDPAERQKRLDVISNQHSTNQSIIRKKWGVRLRGIRTKAYAQASRKWAGVKGHQELIDDAKAYLATVAAGRPIPQPQPLATPASAHRPPPVVTPVPVPAPASAQRGMATTDLETRGGFVAANRPAPTTTLEPDPKRPRLGSSNFSATPVPVQPPMAMETTRSADVQMIDMTNDNDQHGAEIGSQTTADEAVKFHDGGNTSDDDDDDSSDDSSDDDIPAALPLLVQRSLMHK